MANERLRPFRDYSEHDVLNLFSFDDPAVSLGTSDTMLELILRIPFLIGMVHQLQSNTPMVEMTKLL